MQAPCDEEGGIIAQGRLDVNWIFPVREQRLPLTARSWGRYTLEILIPTGIIKNESIASSNLRNYGGS